MEEEEGEDLGGGTAELNGFPVLSQGYDGRPENRR